MEHLCCWMEDEQVEMGGRIDFPEEERIGFVFVVAGDIHWIGMDEVGFVEMVEDAIGHSGNGVDEGLIDDLEAVGIERTVGVVAD